MPRGKKQQKKAEKSQANAAYNLRSSPESKKKQASEPAPIAQEPAELVAQKPPAKKKANKKPYNDSTVSEILSVG